MSQPDDVVEVEFREKGKYMIEVPPAAIVAFGVKEADNVSVYIDTTTKRLIYQF